MKYRSQAGEEMQQLTAEKIKHIFQRTKADAYTSVDNGDGSWTVTFKGGKTSMEAAMYYVSIDKVKWKQTINFKEELD